MRKFDFGGLTNDSVAGGIIPQSFLNGDRMCAPLVVAYPCALVGGLSRRCVLGVAAAEVRSLAVSVLLQWFRALLMSSSRERGVIAVTCHIL